MPDLLSKYKEIVGNQQRADLGTSLVTSLDKKPEDYAETLDLAQRMGLPTGVVEQDKEAVRKQAKLDKYRALLSKSPITKQSMTDPDFAGVAHDDLENLTLMEEVLSGLDYIGGQAIEGGIGIARHAAGAMQMWSDIYAKRLKEHYPGDPEITANEDFSRYLQRVTTTGILRADDIARRPGVMGYVGDVVRGAPQIAAQVGITVATGGVGGMMFMGAQISGGQYQSLRAKGVDVETAITASLVDAALQAPLEQIGIGRAMKAWKATGGGAKVFKNFIESAGTEFFTEWLQKYPEAATEIWAEAQGKGQGAQEQVDIFLNRFVEITKEGIYEGLVAAPLGGIVGGAGAVYSNRQQVKIAKDQATAIQRVMGIATESKLRDRSPAKYRAWVKNILAQGQVEEFHIEAEKIKETLEQAGMPADKFAEISEAFKDQYETALANGQDIIIPADEYLTHIVGTELNDALMPHLRGNAGGLSLFEAEGVESRETADLEAYEKAFEEQEGIRTDPVAQIAQEIAPQLLDIGLSTSEGALDEAELVGQWFTKQAERAGVDPVEYFRRWGLEITKEGAGVTFKDVSMIDVEIDRARNLAKGEAARPAGLGPNLIEFFRRSGGLKDEGGELRAMDMLKQRPGTLSIVGTDLDTAALNAWQAGYFPESEARPTVAELLEAIRDELAGRERLTAEDIELQAERNASAEQLLEFVTEAGLSIETATNEEIKTALEEGMQVEPKTLMQKAKELVTGKKRVEVPGKIAKTLEQSVYHGTPHRFDKFSLEAMGTGEGNQAYGWGLYFAGKKEVAEWYRDVLGGEDIAWSVDGKVVDIDLSTPFGLAVKTLTNPETYGTPEEMIETYREQGIISSPWVDELEKHFKELSAKEVTQKITKKGQIVQADIPDDNVMLHWDLPIEGQPPKIREILEKWRKDEGESFHSGEDAYGAFTFKARMADSANPEMDASKELDSLGIKGIKYADATSRTGGSDQSFNYVVFDDSVVTVEAVNDELVQAKELAHGKETDPRATITFLTDKTIIKLGKKADLSSFQHEAAHLFLAAFEELGNLPDADTEIVADLDAVREWVGAKPGEKFTVKQEESFARGWEKYLWEGKAPSIALRRAFQRFSAWFRRVYSRLQNIDKETPVEDRVELTDEIRAVFDRMLASEEEIQAEQAINEVTQMEGLENDMSPEEFKAYSEGRVRAHREAIDDLTREKLKVVRAGEAEWARAERKRVHGSVTARLNEEPVYKAISWLGKGEWISTEEKPTTLQPMRLDRDTLEADYGPEIFKYIRVSVPPIYGKDGVNPNVAASTFGFESGDALLGAIMDATPKGKAIKEQTNLEMEARLAEKVATGLNPSEEAVKAIHNDETVKAIATELRVVRRKANQPQSAISVIKKAAERIIQNSTLKVAQRVGTYRQAEFRANKKAQEAYLAGDYELAAEQKRIELLNHFKVSEALKAKERVRIVTKRLKAAPSAPKVQEDWRAQIQVLLERYEMAKIPDVTRETPPLRDFVLDHLAQELSASKEDDVAALFATPMLQEWIFNEEDRREFDKLTLEELGDLDDAVKYLKGKGKEALAPDMATEKGTVAEAVERRLVPMQGMKDRKHYAEQGIPAYILAYHSQLQAIFNRADGYAAQGGLGTANFDGPNRRGYLSMLKGENAQNAHLRELKEELKPHLEVLGKFVRRNPKKMLFGLPIPMGFKGTVEDYWTPEKVFTSLLHIGTDSNAARLMDGLRIGDDKNANKEFATKTLGALTKSLNVKELEALQGIWDAVESMWPALADTHEKLYHFRPKKIEARPISVESADGTIVELKGGYFPAIYDRKALGNVTATERYSKQDLLNSAAAAFGSMTPNRSMTKERADGPAGLLLDFSINVLFSHLQTTTTLIHLGLPLKDMQRVVNNQDWRTMFIRKFGISEFETLNKILKNVANPGSNRPGKAGRVLSVLKSLASPFILGYNYAVVLKQSLSTFSAVDDIGVRRYIKSGLAQVTAHPKESFQFMVDSSEQMKGRFEQYDELIHTYNSKNLGRHPAWSTVDIAVSTPFLGIKVVDFMTVFPIWQAAYRAHLERNHTMTSEDAHAEAVVQADALVAATQPAPGAVNRAPVQFEQGWWQGLNMFIGYTLVFNNRARTAYGKFKANKSPKEAANLAFFVGLEALMPVLAIELLHYGVFGDDDDLKELLGNIFAGVAKLIFGGLVGIRDFVGIATDIPRGKRHFDPLRSPGVEIAARFVNDMRAVYVAIEKGEPVSDKALYALAEALSIATKVPVTQAYKRIKRDMKKFEKAHR